MNIQSLPALGHIDAERKQLGISIEALCREACISQRGYFRNLQFRTRPRDETLWRLQRALEQLKQQLA